MRNIKRRAASMVVALISGVALLGGAAWAAEPESAPPRITRDERLAALIAAYPDANLTIAGNELIAGEARITIEDGRAKTHAEKLVDADVEDMLSQIYPLGDCVTGKPTRNEDPGRIRNGELMKVLFGASAKAVRATLVRVPWFGGTVTVTRAHGVDAALKAVAEDLARLPKSMRRYFMKTGGTFNWRVIAGTKRLSVHSFAAAIDLNTKYADYWRWSGGKPGRVPSYRNKYPQPIIEAFERHGFIWGGRWYHYDTMHFEYRPEIIAIARLAEQRGCPRA